MRQRIWNWSDSHGVSCQNLPNPKTGSPANVNTPHTRIRSCQQSRCEEEEEMRVGGEHGYYICLVAWTRPLRVFRTTPFLVCVGGLISLFSLPLFFLFFFGYINIHHYLKCFRSQRYSGPETKALSQICRKLFKMSWPSYLLNLFQKLYCTVQLHL